MGKGDSGSIHGRILRVLVGQTVATAVVSAVLNLHQATTLRAAVTARFGEGRCAYCASYPLIREYTGYLSEARKASVMHEHVDPHPWCITCDAEETESYPCATVCAIASALGVEI